MRTRLIASLACVWLPVAALAQEAPPAPRASAVPAVAYRQAQFGAALAAFRSRHYAGAYRQFVELADQGHAEAARIAWQMYRWGPALYGARWHASEPQLRAWSALVAEEALRLQEPSPDP